MSIRTEYKPGDRVTSAVRGKGTVVGEIVDQNYKLPAYRIVYDGQPDTIRTVSYVVLSLLPEHSAPKPSTAVGRLRIDVELAPEPIADAFIDKVADRIHNYKHKCPNKRCNNHTHEGGFSTVAIGTVKMYVCTPCALEINKSLSAVENAKDFGPSRYVTGYGQAKH